MFLTGENEILLKDLERVNFINFNPLLTNCPLFSWQPSNNNVN